MDLQPLQIHTMLYVTQSYTHSILMLDFIFYFINLTSWVIQELLHQQWAKVCEHAKHLF